MPKSGLIALANSVRSQFEILKIQAVVTPVGLKYRSFQVNQDRNKRASRVVFIPGAFEGDEQPRPLDEGTLGPPLNTVRGMQVTLPNGQQAGQRALYQWDRIFTVCIWGVDGSDRTSEEAQIEATEALAELTLQAMYNATDPSSPNAAKSIGQASLIPGRVLRVYPPGEMGFGAELLFQFSTIGPFYDRPESIIFPTQAIITGQVNPGT